MFLGIDLQSCWQKQNVLDSLVILAQIGIKLITGGIISSIVGSILDDYMKISVSLSQELVEYIDRSVDNRSKLIESLLLNWQKSQQRESMVSACLVLDKQQLAEEEEWQQAAITDWEVSG